MMKRGSFTLLLLLGWGSPVAAFTFAVIGDYGDGGTAEAEVAAQVRRWSPEFILTVGDNNYPSGAASTIDDHVGRDYHTFIAPYHGAYGQGASVNRFFPTLGNHDWGTKGAAPYLAYFVLPGNERYYDFVNGPVHFFAIDSDRREPDGTTPESIQGRWLKQRLAASTETFKIVYFHHAPFSSSSRHGPSAWMQWPFKAWGTDAVLSGHDHTYERIIDPRDGMLYLVDGLGGGGYYGFGAPIPGSQKRFTGDFGALRVTVEERAMTFEFITRRGTLIDRYILFAQ
jgi:tartrate-resistant acid phosphatase type 5